MGVKCREWKGAHWLFVNYKGRRKAVRVGEGKAGKRAAEAAAEQIQAKLALGDLSPLEPAVPPAPVVTFRAYVTQWLDGQAGLRCKPSTVAHYRRMLATHWVPAFGDLPLSALTRERVKTTLGGLVGLRASTIRNGALVALQSMLSAAVEDGWLPANPAARLARFVRSDTVPQERIRPFTRDELAHLLAVAETTAPAAYPALLTLARTGLRFGELAGLQPEDLDFRDRAVWVRRGVYRRWESTPKNGKGRRVDMSQQLARVLQGSLTVREAEAILSGRPAPTWLFPGARGGPLNHRHFLEGVWRPLLARAGLGYRPPHQLRHTFASLLIQQGESLAYVRDQLGHHSIKLTVDVYGHLVPGANRQAVDRLDDATIRNPRATASEAPVSAVRAGG